MIRYEETQPTAPLPPAFPQHHAGPYPAPYWAASPPPQPEPPHRTRPRGRVLAVVAAIVAGLVLMTGIALVAVDLATPDPVALRGELQLSTRAYGIADGGACAGANGYADIAPGQSVVLRDADGHLLAATALTSGVFTAANRFQGTCTFRFEFSEVGLTSDGDALYTIAVGTSDRRGEVPFTGDQLRAGAVLTLGG